MKEPTSIDMNRRHFLLASGAVLATTALVLAGCTEPSNANKPTPGISQTGETPTPSANETQDSADTIGQDTEIARDQLNIIEQKTSFQDMDAMSPTDFAHLSAGDRSAYGWLLMSKLIPDGQKPYTLETLADDKVSFYSEDGVRSGNGILGAHNRQENYLTRATKAQAEKMAIAWLANPLDVSGNLAPYTTNEMKAYTEKVGNPDLIISSFVAQKETGWVKIGKDWVKVIERIGDNVDQTIQVVRNTVALDSGTEVVWYSYGQMGELKGGDERTTYAQTPVN